MIEIVFTVVILISSLVLFRRLQQKTAKMTVEQPQEKNQNIPDPDGPFALPDPSTINPPCYDPITIAELAKYDGSDPELPIYVAIKGLVYDVTRKRDMYKKGMPYNVFAGKDASHALGKHSLKPVDAHSDYSGLDEEEMKVLNDYESYFQKRYSIVGKVIQ